MLNTLETATQYIHSITILRDHSRADATTGGKATLTNDNNGSSSCHIEGYQPEDDDKPSFLAAFQTFADSRKANRTREIYTITLDRIKEYDCNADKLTFEDVTVHWLKGFDTFMTERSPSQNARNIHLRNIRAVFNDALDNEYTQTYPFRKFKIKAIPTVKRSLSVARMRTLLSYTPTLARQVKSLESFKLIFYLIGINLIDLCALKPENYVDGRINFYRAKTGRLYSIKVEPEAQELIERYKGKEHLLDISDIYGDNHNFLKRLNRNLQEIADELGLPRITSYWARHTWATLAAELDIPKETIAAALGHGGQTVTDVYIDFDQRKVDEANRRVIDYVKSIKPED